MLLTKSNTLYKAFGLNILSEIPLPELAPLYNPLDRVDVEVKLDFELERLSTASPKAIIEDNKFVVNDNIVIFKLPNVATFSIFNGNKIIVSPDKKANEDEIRLYILGTCMGAILMQRKIFPLHGSAVVIDEKAYAFVGDSGAGKSTLASALLNRGYKLLTDDVIAVYFAEDLVPLVKPSYPQQKLWEESLNHFGMETENYRPIYQRETKYTVPVHTVFSDNPYPLAGVFELKKSNQETIQIEEIEKLKKLRTLFFHTYRNFFIPKLGLMEWHFNFSSILVNHIKMFELQRPTSSFTANELVDVVIDTINK